MSKFGTVKVSGSSMLPAYRDGDWLLVSWFPAGLTPLVGDRILRRISRRATASPATGSHHLHEDEQKALLLEAFTR